MSSRARRRSARSPCGSRALRQAALALVVLAGAFACAPSADVCCVRDADCAQGARCFEGACVPSCHDDSHCLEGEQCLAGACVAPLRGPARCPFVDKRVLQRPSDDAGQPTDAGGGALDAGPIDPVCADPFEPNDHRGEASPLSPGTASARICPEGDDDWYRVVVPAGSIDLSVVVRFEHDDGDLDVEIIDEGGHRVAVSQLTGNREEIRLPVQSTGTSRELFVHVYGFGRAMNAYELELALLPSTAVCVDDALEDNDTEATATVLAPGALLSAAFCAGDPDVFRAPIAADTAAYGVLFYERGDELTLGVRATGSVAGSSSTFSGLELVPFTVAAAGSAYLRVAGTHSQVDARPYQVGLWVLDDSCGDDAFEPNDLVSEAKGFSVQAGEGFSAVQGRLCERDVDVWRLSWQDGASSVELSLSAPLGTRGYVVRASDLSLIAPLTPGQAAVISPGVNVVAGRVLVVLMGTGEDEAYQLRGRASVSE